MTTAAPHPAFSADIVALHTFDAALGSKDRYTQRHAHRVAEYAMRLACRIGLTQHQIRQIGIGGLLHDVGKIGLSNRIFHNKSYQLCRELREEVQQHPILGVSILKGVGFPAAVLECVYCHHERLDGTGYPRGLKAEKIPLGAKIISVVDCFDAITTNRPYQKRKTCQQAFEILRKLSGSSLDPALVEAFIEEVSENGVIRDRSSECPSESLPPPAADRDVIRTQIR